MSHELRNQNKIYKEKIIKIVEDHSACRHLALVVGKDRPMRWIPATASMQVRLRKIVSRRNKNNFRSVKLFRMIQQVEFLIQMKSLKEIVIKLRRYL